MSKFVMQSEMHTDHVDWGSIGWRTRPDAFRAGCTRARAARSRVSLDANGGRDDLAALKAERDAADRTYNDALTRLDRAIQQLPAGFPHPPPPPSRRRTRRSSPRAVPRFAGSPCDASRGRLRSVSESCQTGSCQDLPSRSGRSVGNSFGRAFNGGLNPVIRHAAA